MAKDHSFSLMTSMQELVFILNKSEINSLGNVRCIEGLRVAVDENRIWIRGIYEAAYADMKLKRLPTHDCYLVDESNLLFVPGALTPVSVLPLLEWMPIAEFVEVEPPVAALPGRPGKPTPIRLVPSAENTNGQALLVTLAIWKAYAESAPATRLERLRFAVSEKNEVIITGNPLPALPGKEYWRYNNILLPNGYHFEIPLVAGFINERFNPEKDAEILFEADGSWQKIDNAFFVVARRSAVRLSLGV